MDPTWEMFMLGCQRERTLQPYVKVVHAAMLAHSIQQELAGTLVLSEVSHRMPNAAVTLFVAKTSHHVNLGSDQVEIKSHKGFQGYLQGAQVRNWSVPRDQESRGGTGKGHLRSPLGFKERD